MVEKLRGMAESLDCGVELSKEDAVVLRSAADLIDAAVKGFDRMEKAAIRNCSDILRTVSEEADKVRRNDED
jgi:hypothetical protein